MINAVLIADHLSYDWWYITFYEFIKVCTLCTHLPFVFYSPKVASDLDESGQGVDQRREYACKTSSSSGQGKKDQYKVFPTKQTMMKMLRMNQKNW